MNKKNNKKYFKMGYISQMINYRTLNRKIKLLKINRFMIYYRTCKKKDVDLMKHPIKMKNNWLNMSNLDLKLKKNMKNV